jgi:Flp pilus assembly protein TadG
MNRRRSPLKALWLGREGSVLVETALVWPALLGVMLGVIELGRLSWTHNALTFAVQEAARCGRVRPDLCGNASAITAYASQKTGAVSVPAANFSVSHPACGLQVSATYNYAVSVGSFVFKTPPVLRARACLP